jgi:hypothetical protein
MIHGKLCAFAVSMGLFLALTADGQPPPGFPPKGPPGGPKGLKGDKGGPGSSARLVDDLKLDDAQRRKAHEAVRAYDEKVREQTRQARQELLGKMKDVLPEDQYRTFKDELDRVPLILGPQNGPRGIATDDLTDRLMGFDANRDGRIDRDELPARMHNLFEIGDTNGDGVLDAAEIKALANRAERNGPPGGGPGGGPPRGPGGGPPNGPPRGPGGPGGGPPGRPNRP